MKIGILASETSWYYRDLERAARSLGSQCERLDFGRLIADGDSSGAASNLAGSRQRSPRDGAIIDPSLRSSAKRADPVRTSDVIAQLNAIIVRTMPPGSLEQVVFRMDLLARFEAQGIQVINSPRSLECAVDKFLTTSRLDAAGLPVPRTIVCEHEDDAMTAFFDLQGDVVVKPLFGSEGRGIVRVSDPDLAHRTFRTLMRLNSVIYLQEYIDHAGFDVRILVLNGKVLGGMKRRSENDFRTNVARDAIAEPHEPTSLEADFAIRATACTGSFVAGVDLLYDRPGRCFVIEVNAVPGWQAFSRVTGIDVAVKLVSELN